MTVPEALIFVSAEIARIEAAHPGKELRPWAAKHSPESVAHWGLIQQRIALQHPNPHLVRCCADLNLDPPIRTRSAAQQAAAVALAARRSRTPDQAVA
jgi:hypothetical protein